MSTRDATDEFAIVPQRRSGFSRDFLFNGTLTESVAKALKIGLGDEWMLL